MPVLAILGFVTVWALTSVWGGYVFSVIWGWFIVPLFHLPVLPVSFAIGLLMVTRYAAISQIDTESSKSSGEKIFESLLMALLYPLIVLIMASIVKLFLPALPLPV